ncbi:MAG TPA: hypothetical protein VK630_04145 [Reyranella sp.]|nr:hypothetical protein [Reyranella sp.]
MPGWLTELVATVLGSTAILSGIAWLFKSWRDDRLARDARQQAIVDKLEARNEALRGKVESMLMDAVAFARETKGEQAERLAMDKQLASVATAMTAALDRSDAANAKLMRGDAR